MIKRIGRRFVSLLLTFVTILTLLPAMTLPALAATSGTVIGLADEKIGLSFTGDVDDAWQIKNANVIGQAESSTGAACNTINHNSTLTITNNKSTTATLSFDYTIDLNAGTIKVGGTNVTAGGKFSSELQAGEEVKVEITSGSTDNPTTITISNIKLIAHVNATVTFLPAENGSYTVDGKPFTEKSPNTQYAMIPYQVVATPNEGYQFRDWYNMTTGKTISKKKSCALNVDENCEITARFVSANTATFLVGSETFIPLDEATEYAKENAIDTITLNKDGTLLQGDYTIPSGVTLLIPFNKDGTVYREKPTATRSATTATPFRTLTMKAGSSITLARGAAISVGGQYFAPAGSQKGQMAGSYGCIKMESGSAITVQNGASLYAWGFISGSGSVTVESGGSVYEWYQIMDFRGGDASTSMGNKVFPFNQYAVQNIEVPLTIYAGASETVQTALYALRSTHSASIAFIGDNGLFKLNSGSLTKAYDGKTDRMIYTIDGNAELKNLKLNLFLKFNIDSKDYVMPLTNNMTIDLNSGSKLTMNQTAALLPGVELSIAKNAELVVPNGQSMYIYDEAEWGKYCGSGNSSSTFIPVVNAPGRNGNRASLEDVKVDVNGKLTAIGGIYTTQSGANICSSEGGGRYVQQGAPGTETLTYQYDGGTNRRDIPITPAQLQNAASAPTLTKDAQVNDTFTYCKCQECGGGTWVPNLKVAAIIDGNGAQADTYATLQGAVEAYKPDNSTPPKNYIQLLHSTTEEINADRNLYLDLNGCTVTGDFKMGNYTLYGMDSTTDNYEGTNAGKIVGSVVPYNKITYQTGNPGDAYKRYVGILGEENGTQTLSFHRFNISVTGYRFELAAPQCALIFRGEFRGDEEAKKHLKSLGFTLTDKDSNPLGTDSSPITDPKDIPKESEPGESKVVLAEDGAFLFEFYLIRSFEKNPTDDTAYTEEFSATAHATFDNGGTQDSGTKDRKTQHLSFQKAWQDSSKTAKDKEILQKFLDEFGIKIQVE